MTNEEAKIFLDNLKVCIEEHPIVADWLVEVADRKTEPQTCQECEHWNDTEDDCADRHGCRTTTEDCSTVDKDINVRSKDEPQTNADQRIQSVESVGAMQTEREGE